MGNEPRFSELPVWPFMSSGQTDIRFRPRISRMGMRGVSSICQNPWCGLDPVWCQDTLTVPVPLTHLLLKDHDSDTFQEEHLIACSLDLMFAGTETTSSTLRWALLFMATHPEIQGTINKKVFCLAFIPHSFVRYQLGVSPHEIRNPLVDPYSNNLVLFQGFFPWAHC